jgi:2-methylcitrate dehydratase PrpD
MNMLAKPQDNPQAPIDQPATQALVRFIHSVCHQDIPSRFRQRVVDAFIDSVGCAFLGTQHELVSPLANLILTTEGPIGRSRSFVIGLNRFADAASAALFNGTITHALDYDDASHPAYSHPSVVLMPALFAAAASGDVTGQDIVTAYAVGIEAFGKLGRALNFGHYAAGWHATGTFGAIAGSAAVARLLRLNDLQTLHALGIAGTLSSGIRANFGTMAKPLVAGNAARNAVTAALLARDGFTAATDILENPFGFLRTFCKSTGIEMEPLLAWGEELEIASDYGLALKPYPSCGGTLPAIEAAIALHHRIDGHTETIASVRVGTGIRALQPLIYVVPNSSLEAKFSMQYCVGAALIDGRVDLDTFGEQEIRRPDILAIIPKIIVEIDERVRDHSEFATYVTITLRNGEQLEAFIPYQSGKADRWMSRTQLLEKFLSCTKMNGTRDWSMSLFNRLTTLDSDVPASDIIRALEAEIPVVAPD